MKVRTLIRQLAMHDMDAEVWLAWQPHIASPLQAPLMITKVDKQRASYGKVVYLQSKEYAKVGCQQQLTQAVDPTMVGTTKHDISDLDKSRKFKELSPEVAGLPANLSVKAYLSVT